jgi:predicted homoserine dehydrogenase-like protein
MLPLGLTDGAIVKRNIMKDESINLSDVELNLPDDVVKARQYQYDLI